MVYFIVSIYMTVMCSVACLIIPNHAELFMSLANSWAIAATIVSAIQAKK